MANENTYEMTGRGLAVNRNGQMHVFIPLFELLEAAQSMGFWIQNTGSFSVADLCKAPPFLDVHAKRAQAAIDFMVDRGVIVADGKRFRPVDGAGSIDRGTVYRMFEGATA